jgi:hypothetical protein
MPKWAKFLIAVLLLPVCLGAVHALGRVMGQCGGADTTWVPFCAGVACWLVIYSLLPKPMWLYVFGHEWTHAVWTWIFGGRVQKMKISSQGGHVLLSKTNFLIALAPYFFPFYAVLVVGAFALGHWIWGWQRFLPWFDLLLGAAYAFHLTLTWRVLQSRQTDITDQGYVFSAVIIFLGNVTVLLLGIPLLTSRVSAIAALGWWFEGTGQVWQRLGQWI